MSDQLDLFDALTPNTAAPAACPPPAEPPDAEPATLREILTSYVSSEATWASLAQHGATDKDLAGYIASLYYHAPKNLDAVALVPQVRAMFGTPPQKLDVTDLPAADLLRIIREECETWRASGRSPIHCRIEDTIDARGEKALTELGWPIHDGAPYVNAHTGGIESYAELADKYLDEHALKRGESRGTNTKYILEHWEPLGDPVAELERAEHHLAAALVTKRPKPKKGKTQSEAWEVTEARKDVALLKAEIERRTRP